MHQQCITIKWAYMYVRTTGWVGYQCTSRKKNAPTWVLVISLCLYIGFIPSKPDFYSLFLAAPLPQLFFPHFLLFVCEYSLWLWGKKTPNSTTKWTNFFHLKSALIFPFPYCPSKRCMPLSLSVSCIFTHHVLPSLKHAHSEVTNGDDDDVGLLSIFSLFLGP